MTTTQIIIFSILMIADITLIILSTTGGKKAGFFIEKPNIFVISMFRFLLIWGIIFACVIRLDQYQSNTPNPCPQLEKVEDVYRIK